MLATTEHLMHAGFRAVYGYTQSDEISLLFHQADRTFGRKLRKWISVLAGEASAKFSLLLGELAAFDCRIAEIPSRARVVDYFRWRGEDAARNCLLGHCHWALRAEGKTAEEATRALAGLATADQHELLYRHGINFNDLPAWQKRGVGLVWGTFTQAGTDPRTGAATCVERKRIRVELELATLSSLLCTNLPIRLQKAKPIAGDEEYEVVVLDPRGNELFAAQLRSIFYEDLALVINDKGKFGFMNQNGQTVIACQYDGCNDLPGGISCCCD